MKSCRDSDLPQQVISNNSIEYTESLSKHQIPVDFDSILESNALKFGLVLEESTDLIDFDESEETTDRPPFPLGNDNRLNDNRLNVSIDAHARNGHINHVDVVEGVASASELNLDGQKLSSKERKAEKRRQKSNKERNLRRMKGRRKMTRVRGFEEDVVSTLSVQTVRGDYSRTTRTQPGFVGKSIKTHKSTTLPSSTTPVSTTTQSHRVTVEDLHRDCDEEVKRLVREGWTYIPNDISCAQVLVDEHDRIIATKARQPRDQEKYNLQHEGAFNCMADARTKVIPSKNSETFSRQRNPKACPIISVGMSFGGGQTKPQPLCGHNNSERTALHELFKNTYIRQMVNNASVDFRTLYPEMSVLFDQLQNRLETFDQEQFGIFKDSPFCGTTFNLGPKASAAIHRDCRNLIGGLCAIIVLGHFNHQTSGHLILHDVRTILEVRPGDVVFIPSAGIAHSNSSLKEHEDRCSIVQYTAGGLFRNVWSKGTRFDGIDTDIGSQRWEESLKILGSVNDRRHRLERAQWMRDHIKQGHSTLLPPPSKL